MDPSFGKSWLIESQIFPMLTHFSMDCWPIRFLTTDLHWIGFSQMLSSTWWQLLLPKLILLENSNLPLVTNTAGSFPWIDWFLFIFERMSAKYLHLDSCKFFISSFCCLGKNGTVWSTWLFKLTALSATRTLISEVAFSGMQQRCLKWAADCVTQNSESVCRKFETLMMNLLIREECR